MSPEMYEKVRLECKNNRCRTCFCSGKEYCFARDLEEKVSDFPNKSYEELNTLEKNKIKKITKPYYVTYLLSMVKGE